MKNLTLKFSATLFSKVALGLGIALFISACATESPMADPPCEQTGAGYFKSTVFVGGYYRCIYDSSIQRWKKYNYTCPSGQEFSDAVKKCVPIAS